MSLIRSTSTLARIAQFSFFALILAALLASPAPAQDKAPLPQIPAQYSANAIGDGGSMAGKTFGLTIYIDGTTTDGQIDELIGILKTKGQDAVVSALQDMKDVGRVAPTGSVGTGMRIVRIRPGKNGGVHIVMATDRPISFGELYNATRSRDYPIGILVMDLDKDGKGTGKFAPLCKVKFNKKKELEIEYYGQRPFRLVNIYRQK
jgi:hypothetical protein